MTGKQVDHLAKMANQIAANLGGGRDLDETARLTAEHLRKFWTRDMRKQLLALPVVDNDPLSPAARQALSDLMHSGEA